MNILLVDDDPLQALVRKSLLEKRSSDVYRVAGAAEALCLVEQPQFASGLGLVVTVHHLAGIGGPAFVAELRTRMPSLPILVLGDSSDAHGKYSGENICYLPRPILAEQILAAATRLLSQNERKTA